jgi:hypothetical protein
MTTGPLPEVLVGSVTDALDPVLGPQLDGFEVVVEVGPEPPEAVELTDAQRFLQHGA